jgi:hypothetical protein
MIPTLLISQVNNPYDYQRSLFLQPSALDGKTALEYVRSRHGVCSGTSGAPPGSRNSCWLSNTSWILEKFLCILKIAVDVQGSVLTSLSMQQVLELASYARGLSSQDFTQMVLGLPEYGYGAVINSPEGIIWVEEQLWGAINQTINQVFPESRTSKH